MKNTYRVLLTRGMKGCYVHFMDKYTENFFRSRMNGLDVKTSRLRKPGYANREGVPSVRADDVERARCLHEGDWGITKPEDRSENEFALKVGLRIMSVYLLKNGTGI